MEIILTYPKFLEKFIKYIAEQIGGFNNEDINYTKMKFYNFENNENPNIMIFKNKIIFANNKKFKEMFPNDDIIG